MDRIRQDFRLCGRWTRAFFSGDYGGAPVDYLMAIAIVYAAMVVTAVNDWV